jgi:hypothetical protein
VRLLGADWALERGWTAPGGKIQAVALSEVYVLVAINGGHDLVLLRADRSDLAEVARHTHRNEAGAPVQVASIALTSERHVVKGSGALLAAVGDWEGRLVLLSLLPTLEQLDTVNPSMTVQDGIGCGFLPRSLVFHSFGPGGGHESLWLVVGSGQGDLLYVDLAMAGRGGERPLSSRHKRTRLASDPVILSRISVGAGGKDGGTGGEQLLLARCRDRPALVYLTRGGSVALSHLHIRVPG